MYFKILAEGVHVLKNRLLNDIDIRTLLEEYSALSPYLSQLEDRGPRKDHANKRCREIESIMQGYLRSSYKNPYNTIKNIDQLIKILRTVN